MSDLKKHSALILMAMLILLIIPMSFATEINDNTTADVVGVNDVDTGLVNINDDSIEGNPKQIAIYDIYENDNFEGNVPLKSNLDSQKEILTERYDYESIPNETEITYVMGTSYAVGITFNFTGDISPYMEKIYAYVNSNVAPIEIKSPTDFDLSVGSHSGIVDIKSFSSYLHEGSNTVIFHPKDNVLSSNGLYNNHFVPLLIHVSGPVTTYYVDSSVTGEADGTEGSTYTTIAAAIAASNANFGDNGGSIIIKEGTNGVYTESSGMSISKNLVIKADDGADVTITSTYTGSLFSQTAKANVNITGLTFRDIQITSGAIFYQDNKCGDKSTLIIQNCSFINNNVPTLVRIYQTKTTVKQTNFIENTLTASGFNGGLINFAKNDGSQMYKYDYTFDISYSNIIGNTINSDYIFTTSESWQRLYANNNYWGSNYTSKPTGIYNLERKSNGDQICMLQLDTWVNLNLDIADEVPANSVNTATLNFVSNTGSVPADNMADLTVDLTSSLDATFNPNSVLISNNKGISTYTAPSTIGLDTISVKYDTNSLTAKDVNISGSQPVSNYDYESVPSPLVVDDYVIGSDMVISVTVVSDYLDELSDNGPMSAWVNGEGSSNKFRIDDVVAGASSFTFNLADVSEMLVVGENTITFHPAVKLIEAESGSTNHNFVALTVNAKQISKPDLSYTITPTPREVSDYIKGYNKIIQVVTSFTDSSYANEELNKCQMYIYINDEEIVLDGVKANNRSFTFDLADYADKLIEGVNNISIHPQFLGLDTIFNNLDFEINNLTVTVIKRDSSYITTPVPNSTDYTVGEDKIIAVNVAYNDFYSDDLSFAKMFVYINGEDIADRVEVEGILSNDTSFEFNLKDISDKLVEGKNNLTFHPHLAALEDIIAGPYTFNRLTVNVEAAVPPVVPTYNVTVGSSGVDYIRGESCNVSVSVVFDGVYAGAGVPVYLYVGDGEGILISGVYANDSSFTVDLADYADKLADGENVLSFHPSVSDLNGIAVGNYSFGNLTVTVTNPPEPIDTSYVTTPAPNMTDYTVGEDKIITVNVAYDDYFNDELSSYSMFVYINGEDEDNRVVISNIFGNSTSFEFNLKDIADKLVVGANNLTFHPYVNALNGILDGPHIFNRLVVNIEDIPEPLPEISYTITPSISSVDYIIGENSIVEVNVTYNSTYSEILGDIQLFVFINDVDPIEINGIKANVSSFKFDLATISEYLTVGKNTISFHPKLNELSSIGNVKYQFGNIAINAENAPEDPDTTYVTIPTPSKVDYTLNESSIITVTVLYDDYFNNDLSFCSMFVYINGEDMANRVKIPGIMGNATNFTFDLKQISDKLVEGQNNLTFHPHPGALEGTFVGPYTYYNLTVNVGKASDPVNPVNPVNKTNATIEITVNNVTVGETVVISIDAPDNATGRVLVEVADKKFNETIENGKIIINVNGLDAGNYTALVSYLGDDNYYPVNSSVGFKVDAKYVPVVPDIGVDVGSAVEGDVVIVNVTLPGDATGRVLVEVADKKFNETVENGKAVIDVDGLAAGNYTALVSYLGDDRYAAINASTKIRVDAKEEPIVPKPIESDVNITLPSEISVDSSTSVKLEFPSDAKGNVTVKIDGKEISTVAVEDGFATVQLPVLASGNHTVEIYYSGDGKYANSTSISSINARKLATHIVASAAFTRVASDYYAKERGAYKYGYLLDENNNPVANRQVEITVNGVTYKVKTDSKGLFKLRISLRFAKKYSYNIVFRGDGSYSATPIFKSKLTITKKKTSISVAKKKVFKAKTKKKIIKVTLKTIKNKYNGKTYLKKGKKITLRINGKTYTAKTNKKGVAKFTIKLKKKGNFIAKIKFAGDKTYKASSKKILVRIK